MKELILKDTNTMEVGDKISDTNGYMYACTNIYSDNDGYTPLCFGKGIELKEDSWESVSK